MLSEGKVWTLGVVEDEPVGEFLGPVNTNILYLSTIRAWTGMEITPAQYEQIASCLPRQRGHVSLSNLQV
ncbi:MAG TPA: hypothetical protein VNK45_06745, partial [Candidatus Acidoferrales bacterium]|nr:hypothetical protein [Candidatus Acidoferrales bacterium]